MTQRPYEIVLLGATGFTGKLTAEYVQEQVATDLKWAIAGRNGKRLEEIAAELKKSNPDRLQPAIEVLEVNEKEVTLLAAKAKVLITTVGPYARYGEPVVAACVAAGTHYLDVTGETPFTYDMLQKYGSAAREKGICLVPHCGIDSVPADLLAYLCAKSIRENLGTGTREVINSLQKLSGSASGGTSHTAIGLTEMYPLTFLGKSLRPTALCPIAAPKSKPTTTGVLPALLGYRVVPELGILTDSPQSSSDVGIVYRSWALFDGGKFYGENFAFSEFMRAKSRAMGAAIHYAMTLFFVGLALRPFRWLLKRYAYKPGEGPSREAAKNDILSYKAIGYPDVSGGGKTREKAVATLHYVGPGYYLTGIFLVEAALCLARDKDDCLAKKLGGMVTPATLEMGYVERLRKAGITIDWTVA